MNENYLKALEGIEELNKIFFNKVNIKKRLGLETFKIDRELLTDKKITSFFSNAEIKKLVYVLSSELLIKNEIKPLIEESLKSFSRSIRLLSKESEKENFILQFNQKIFDFYLFLGQYLVLPKDDSDNKIELMYLSNYLNSIMTGNVFDIFSLNDKINDVKEINEKYYFNNIKIYLSDVDYIENLVVVTLQILCNSWTLAISNFDFLDESYSISKYIYGMTVFIKKEKEVIDKHIKKETLYDIWLGERTDYLNEIFSKLKEQNVMCDLTFVSENDGELNWNPSSKSWSKYLAGLYRVLVEKKWVKNNKSAHKIAKILTETFNFQDEIDSKNFRTDAMGIDKRFKEPFEFIKENHN